MSSSIQRCRLLESTLDLLVNRPRQLTLQLIATETGLKETWLQYLVMKRGTEIDPSVNKIVCLYEYLTHRTLEI